MRKLFFVYSLFLAACVESKSGSIEIKSSHQHQLALKAVKSGLPPTDYFEVYQWYPPDTLTSWPAAAIQMPIRYKFDFDYKDKSNVILKKYGIVVFNGDTDSVLVADILDRP